MKAAPSLLGAPWLADPRLQRLLAVVKEAGGEARVAGGAVRNALLGEPIADVDVATTLKPEAVMAAAERAGFGVHPTGLKHGTVTITVQKHPFEVTTLRIDVETDGRRAKVQYTDDWALDAARRDFTMNALFCGADGKVFDFAGGVADTLKRRVRFVGLPSARIKEDYLRILRFFRFHAKYGKGWPDAQGLAACTRLRKGLAGLSAERIRQELMKLLVAPRAVQTLSVMKDARILPLVVPGANDLSVLRRLVRIDRDEDVAPDALLRLASLVEEPLTLKDRLRLTNSETRRLETLHRSVPPTPALRDRERRAVLYHLGAEGWRDAVRLAWARGRGAGWRELHDFADVHPPKVFPVKGADLLAAGHDPGPALGALLLKLEDWWIAADFAPTKEDLLNKAKP